MTATCAAGALCLASVALAQAPAAKPESVSSVSETVTATVMNIDQKTREVTLKTADGHESTFIAGDEVKNLAQVKKGDLVTTTYKESLVYEVKKGGKAREAETTTTTAHARPGAMPAGIWAQRTTLTVTITAIDPKIPTVTFKGPAGNTRTIKVQDPAKLKGVNVGDSVEITFVEAVAIKVERAPKK
jgi:Cu/Ag efflux protein CusF